MLSVTKTFEFEAAHRLPHYEGPCQNIHGHSYKLEVEISGLVQYKGGEEGMIVDFVFLKQIVKERVVDKLDHKYLNDILPTPTAENLVLWIYDQIMGWPFLNQAVARIRLWETSTSYCEWKKG